MHNLNANVDALLLLFQEKIYCPKNLVWNKNHTCQTAGNVQCSPLVVALGKQHNYNEVVLL